MLIGKIKIQGYRSIPFDNPITLSLNKGITYIVGPNNIGKSNFLKPFFELRSLLTGNHIISSTPHLNFNSGLPGHELENILNQKTKKFGLQIEVYNEKGESFRFFYSGEGKLRISQNSKSQIESFHKLGEVTTLLGNTMYVSSFRYPYFNVNSDIYDIGMGQRLIQQIDSWKYGNNINHKLMFEEFENEIKNLLGFSQFQISPTSNNQNLEIRSEDGIYLLTELGSGIAHILIVLLNALIKKPAYILIDEPENGLHPRLQRDFILVLASKAKYGLLATTHSLGLALSTGDYVYSMFKDREAKIHLKDYQGLPPTDFVERLSELSYSSFCDIGGNHILMVEGKEDIKFFKEILNKYGIGQYFIVMDLGGDISLKTFEKVFEINRLNPRSINVIVDSDRTSEDSNLSRETRELLERCSEHKISAITTDFNATENYINQRALDTVFPNQKMLALRPYENYNDRKDNKWSKTDNWLLVREMFIQDFEGTALDAFMKTLQQKINI